jgi:hypothetical protein
MYVHGGIRSSKSAAFASQYSLDTLSNQLWTYNTITSRWTQIQANYTDPNTPPALAGHTLTPVDTDDDGDDDVIFLIGGRSVEAGFSAFVFMFNISTSQWTRIVTLGNTDVNVWYFLGCDGIRQLICYFSSL